MIHPVLLYSPFCPVCPAVIIKCVEYFNQKRIPLLIRLPTSIEKTQIPALPALYIPKEVLNLDKPYVLIGDKIPEWLEDMEKQLNGRSEDHN